MASRDVAQVGEGYSCLLYTSHATSSLNALEDHNRRAALYHRLQYAELQNMVRMLTSTVGTVSVTSQTNVCILNEIEKNVEVASELDDVRVCLLYTSRCV